MKYIKCTACELSLPRHRQHCPECHGVGYTEVNDVCTAGRDWFEVCPLESEPMVGGWLCTKCGASGPMPKGKL